jgi:hypothetical protein
MGMLVSCGCGDIDARFRFGPRSADVVRLLLGGGGGHVRCRRRGSDGAGTGIGREGRRCNMRHTVCTAQSSPLSVLPLSHCPVLAGLRFGLPRGQGRVHRRSDAQAVACSHCRLLCLHLRRGRHLPAYLTQRVE